MSEEVMQAAGDLAYWRQRAVRAESDVAALSAAISAYIAAGDTQSRAEAWRAMRDLAETAHPGAALRERAEQADAAALKQELEAARAVVEALRRHYDAGGEVWGSIDRDFAAYDAAVKARAE